MGRMVILFMGLYFFTVGCSTNDSTRQPFSVQRDSTVVKLKTFYAQVGGYGRIETTRTEVLSARFDGNISFPRQRGSYAKGEIIYRLTGPDIEKQRAQLYNTLAEAQAKSDFMAAVYNRKKSLIEKKVLAPKERDEIIYNYRSAKEELKQAGARMEYFLKMTGYEAPFDGYLSDIVVSPGDFIQKGQRLARFNARSNFKLVGTLYGKSSSFVKQGALLKVEFRGKTKIDVKIIFLEQNINPRSGGHTFWAELDSLPSNIQPGAYVSYVLKGFPHQAPAVPASALILEKGRYYAVLCANGQYRNVQILSGLSVHGFSEVKKGLKAGDIVLTAGAFETFHRNLQKNLKIAD